MKLKLSVIVPVYNAEKSIVALVNELYKQLSHIHFELILVNDSSHDNSASLCKQLVNKFDNLKYIGLRKNFGEFNAVICGLNHSKGAYSVIIDVDFQNPPSEILKLLNEAENGDYDVVYSQYKEKKHSFYRNLGSQIVNKLTTFLLKKPPTLYLSSFKIIKKELVEEIVKFKNPFTYIDGIIFQMTNNIGQVEVTHVSRGNGQSNYTISKLFSLFLTVIFGYSLLPLRLTFFAGIFSIICSLIYMALYFLQILPEWGSPVIIFLGGVILTSIALVGEYMGKSFMISGKPQYIVKEIVLNPTSSVN